jgi:hypothetical protein
MRSAAAVAVDGAGRPPLLSGRRARSRNYAIRGRLSVDRFRRQSRCAAGVSVSLGIAVERMGSGVCIAHSTSGPLCCAACQYARYHACTKAVAASDDRADQHPAQREPRRSHTFG